MFRSSALRVHSLLNKAANVKNASSSLGINARMMSKASTETDAQFDQRYQNFFNQPDIDGWDVRRGITELLGHDLVPEPKITISILQACRRVNDLALAIRVLEAVKDKCGGNVKEIYPWYMQELKPTLTELGIPTIEELGYDKPELALQNPEEM
ncbi:cytochrome c oxidase subunit 5A, mitochondrial-like [Anthonomus grandis grandis]|uniref:cytochrome c oxidase subunit 5A, mitochondrial-like n=1 Tax=Anthonomus grandis grandis TaxID=2921223 RepID=UPI0021657844|nr:cytochrome c oxidase subunit 5A, mitochondrial-like [Anthonomus grandis grandis]